MYGRGLYFSACQSVMCVKLDVRIYKGIYICILCIENKCQFGGGRFNACFVLDYCACQCIRTIVALIMHTVQNHSLRRRKDSKFFPIYTKFGTTEHPVPKPDPVHFRFPMFVLRETKCDGKCPTIAECKLNYTHGSGEKLDGK